MLRFKVLMIYAISPALVILSLLTIIIVTANHGQILFYREQLEIKNLETSSDKVSEEKVSLYYMIS